MVSRLGRAEVVHFLAKHPAELTAQDSDGWTPLHFASAKGHVEGVQFLVGHGADVTTRNKDGKTPWIWHRKMKMRRSCSSLFGRKFRSPSSERGANVMTQATPGWTSLSWASQGEHALSGYSSMVQIHLPMRPEASAGGYRCFMELLQTMQLRSIPTVGR